MKISSIKNISFKTTHLEKAERNPSVNSHYGKLNHATQFFRYDNNDEFIISILKNKNPNVPLNIISAGCSFGEEVYSFAMALEDLKHKPNIIGIDVSEDVIKEANIGSYMLDSEERSLFEDNFKCRIVRPKTPYREELKRRFYKNFELINPKFHEYKKKDDSFQNCSFLCANLNNISSLFEEDSQDVILCRMVLYHMTHSERNDFFAQAYKILKPGGMLCIEPFGHYNYHQEIMSAGFEHPYNNALFIYTKPEKDINYFEHIKKLIVHNKSNFNHI